MPARAVRSAYMRCWLWKMSAAMSRAARSERKSAKITIALVIAVRDGGWPFRESKAVSADIA